jgi:hypothetical protein
MMTVAYLKHMIAIKEDIAEHQQRLLYAGRQLEDCQTLRDYKIQKDNTVHLVLRLLGGGSGGPPITISEIEPVMREKDVSALLEDHSVEGYWLNSAKLMKQSGLVVPPKLPLIAPNLSEKVLATVLALAILRKRYQDQRDLWQLLELKALKWLGSATRRSAVNWTSIIDSIVATLQ